MACPHGAGSPASCSQCIGAPARAVKLSAGHVLVDDVSVGTVVDHTAHAEDRTLLRPSGRRGGHSIRRCAVCHRPGHNARTCTVELE